MINVAPLAKALNTLVEALDALAVEPSNTLIRDATIQRFEYCYELSHKMLRRFLAETEPNPAEIGEMSFPDMIRLGVSRGLLDDEWADWRLYRDARNKTSHIYDEATAAEVIEVVPAFLASAKKLLAELESRIADFT